MAKLIEVYFLASSLDSNRVEQLENPKPPLWLATKSYNVH